MFYDKLKPLCHSKGITPWRMATDLGISPRTQANWKKGSEPREETKIKIAEYLARWRIKLTKSAHTGKRVGLFCAGKERRIRQFGAEKKGKTHRRLFLCHRWRGSNSRFSIRSLRPPYSIILYALVDFGFIPPRAPYPP